ncbi:MAG: thiamine pyrophosphate-requiring protein [Candidatus Binatia bacterium]|nr:thiamine pyrophosphate-requiring protein [Candidatus Binatia bacterium]
MAARITIAVENTAQAYLELLRAMGVKYFFGNAGTDFASLIDAFAKFAAEGKTTPIPLQVPHEFCAVSMAHGYYLVTGEPPVVMVHTTVGTANALCGLINAARAHIPLILTAGRTPITEAGTLGSRDLLIHWAQESFDQGAMVREYVKWDYELRSFAQLETVVRRAFALAMSEPKGPVYLTLPREVLAEPHDVFSFEQNPGFSAAVSLPFPDPEQIEEIATLLAEAAEPLIITRTYGRNVGAVPALVALAESFAIPVIEYPFPAHVNFPAGHPLHLGFDPGVLLPRADVILVLDCDVPWIPSLHRPSDGARVVHLGTDPLQSRYPVWGFPVSRALVADTAVTVPLLSAALQKHRAGREAIIAQRFQRLAQEHEAQRARWRHEAEEAGRSATLTFEWISHCLDRLKDDEMIFVNEYDLSLRHIEFNTPGSYLGFSPAGGLGWGVGGALGVKLGAPEQTVISVVGDGTYLFSVPSACHLVSAMYHLPVLFVICNNGGWGATQAATRGLHPHGWAVRTEHFPFGRFAVQPAYEMFAQACGGYGEVVRHPRDLPDALRRALRVVREEQRQALVNVDCGNVRGFGVP